VKGEHLWFYGLPRGGAKVERLDLPIDRLPEGLDGARILFAADVHAGFTFLEAAVDLLIDQISGLAPDLILWGGDLAENRLCAEHLFEKIGRLKPKFGMAAVVGNNDRRVFRASLAPMRDMALRAGVTLLVNERRSIPVPGGALTLLGLDENYCGTPDPSILTWARGQREAAILLSHSPAPLDRLLRGAKLPDLILCGHTHGGQARLFGLTPYDFHFDGVRRGQPFFTARGVVRERGATVVVTAGLGSSKIPLRINCPPELWVITLRGR
jgi:predicted MPP superfamily phosphohydrolase